MLKKVTITLLVVLALQVLPAGISESLAQGTTNPQAPAPAENLESGAFMFDLSTITQQNIESSVRQSWIRNGINYFFERIIGFLAAVIGSLAVLMLTVGGFLMLSSAGDETRYEKGKNYAKYSLIGLGITLSAYILVTLVQLLIKSIYG